MLHKALRKSVTRPASTPSFDRPRLHVCLAPWRCMPPDKDDLWHTRYFQRHAHPVRQDQPS